MKQLKLNLLTYYLFAYEATRNLRLVEAKLLLKELRLECGICWAARQEANTNLYKLDWVMKYVGTNGMFWGILPKRTRNTKQLLKALQLRIDILTKEIAK